MPVFHMWKFIVFCTGESERRNDGEVVIRNKPNPYTRVDKSSDHHQSHEG